MLYPHKNIDIGEQVLEVAKVAKVVKSEGSKMPDLALSVDVRHHEFIDKGVKGPPGLRVLPPAVPWLAPDKPEAVPVATAHGGYIRRRTPITKADLPVHGYTAGFLASLAPVLTMVQEGKSLGGVQGEVGETYGRRSGADIQGPY